MPEEQHEKEYLGDGVYAWHDGYGIWLETVRQIGRPERIALDDETFAALVDYRKRLLSRLNHFVGANK